MFIPYFFSNADRSNSVASFCTCPVRKNMHRRYLNSRKAKMFHHFAKNLMNFTHHFSFDRTRLHNSDSTYFEQASTKFIVARNSFAFITRRVKMKRRHSSYFEFNFLPNYRLSDRNRCQEQNEWESREERDQMRLSHGPETIEKMNVH